MNTQLINFVHRNNFTSLIDFTIKCHKFHNYGHKTKFCRSKLDNSSKSNNKNSKIVEPKVNVNNYVVKGVWKKKDNNAIESFIFQVALKAKNNTKSWIIVSNCIKYITDD